ncbi:hypothetical protein BHE74_00007014 [Ensete ventricosum]|nr:hypothetical protein BHE74_00007014 [Ensete ventricosum]
MPLLPNRRCLRSLCQHNNVHFSTSALESCDRHQRGRVKRKRKPSPRVCLCTHHKAKTGRTCLPGSFDVYAGGRPSRHLCFRNRAEVPRDTGATTPSESALDIVQCASARIVKQET